MKTHYRILCAFLLHKETKETREREKKKREREKKRERHYAGVDSSRARSE